MKKKVFAIALAAFVFALSIVGSSVAYFTDVENATNVFTAGDVNISLTYAGSVANQESSQGDIHIENTKVYPNQNFDIDATITNVGSEDAFVGAIITLKDSELTSFIAPTSDTSYPVAVRDFLVGLAKDGFTVKYAGNGTSVLTIYVVKNAAIANNETAVLFKDIKIPASWDHAQMLAFTGFEISVKAYATQTKGFADATAVTAITSAFTDWTGFSGATTLD